MSHALPAKELDQVSTAAGRGPGVAFAVLRHHANAADDLAEAHRIGEAMATRSGVPARVTALDVTLRRFGAVQSIGDYDGFRRALLADRPIVGRTSYRSDGGTVV